MTLVEYAPAGAMNKNGWTLALCIAMLVLFATLSYSAALTKNATFDEPLHAVSGYVIRNLGDYRLDPEDPAFFTWLSAIPHTRGVLNFDSTDVNFKQCFRTHDLQWVTSIDALYRNVYIPSDDQALDAWASNFAKVLKANPKEYGFNDDVAAKVENLVSAWHSAYAADFLGGGPATGSGVSKQDAREAMLKFLVPLAGLVGSSGTISDTAKAALQVTLRQNADQYIDASRFLFMLIGLITGVLVCWWAWNAAGRIGAFVATAAYALDPNFLGHASLVKNDVPLAMVTVGLMFSLWRFGRRGTWWNLAAIIVCLCLAMNIKFSGPIFFVIAFIVLRLRAAMNQSWQVIRWELKERANRWMVPYLVCAAAAVCSFVFIWWCYGFRYAPTPNPDVHFDFYAIAERYQTNILQIIHAYDTKPHNAYAEQGNVPLPAPIHVIHFLEQCRILPEAWLHGLFYTYATTVMRGAYLNGQHSLTGWWYFFPLCVLYKTPMGTLCLLAVALAVVLAIWVRKKRKPADWLIVVSLVMLLIRVLIWSFDVHFPVLSASLVQNITHSDSYDQHFAADMAKLGASDASGRIIVAQDALDRHQYSKAKEAIDAALHVDPNDKDALDLEHQINNEMRPSWFNWVFNLLMLAPIVIRVGPAVLRSDATSNVWLLVCLITPMVLYGGSAMSSNFNLGIRHVLPLLPLLHVALGVAAARLLARWGQIGALVVGFLGAALAIESCAAWPNYISFFNAPSGGERGGIGKLSDSNLDWGQDLVLLEKWHKEHLNKNVYLCYFGMADPTYYELTPRIDLAGGYELSPKQSLPQIPGVIAISATDLQGTYTYWNSQIRDFYSPLWKYEPREVLGGTIYLYDWPLKAPTTQH